MRLLVAAAMLCAVLVSCETVTRTDVEEETTERMISSEPVVTSDAEPTIFRAEPHRRIKVRVPEETTAETTTEKRVVEREIAP